jgi:hypothetical protein
MAASMLCGQLKSGEFGCFGEHLFYSELSRKYFFQMAATLSVVAIPCNRKKKSVA